MNISAIGLTRFSAKYAIIGTPQWVDTHDDLALQINRQGHKVTASWMHPAATGQAARRITLIATGTHGEDLKTDSEFQKHPLNSLERFLALYKAMHVTSGTIELDAEPGLESVKPTLLSSFIARITPKKQA